MSCNKTSLSCGSNTEYFKCLLFQGELPEFSELDECANGEEIVEEIYSFIGELQEDTDLSELESNCINLPTEKTVKNVTQTLIDFICQQNETIEEMETNITVLQQQVANLQQNTCP